MRVCWAWMYPPSTLLRHLKIIIATIIAPSIIPVTPPAIIAAKIKNHWVWMTRNLKTGSAKWNAAVIHCYFHLRFSYCDISRCLPRKRTYRLTECIILSNIVRTTWNDLFVLQEALAVWQNNVSWSKFSCRPHCTVKGPLFAVGVIHNVCNFICKQGARIIFKFGYNNEINLKLDLDICSVEKNKCFIVIGHGTKDYLARANPLNRRQKCPGHSLILPCLQGGQKSGLK